MDPRDYLKRATDLKKQGQIKEAIDQLRICFQLSKELNYQLMIDDFLRLPMYYAYDNDFQNATIEIEKLEKHSTSNIELFKIFDTKRKILQKEKKIKESVIYSLLSIIFEFKNLDSDQFSGLQFEKECYEKKIITKKEYEQSLKNAELFQKRVKDSFLDEINLKKLLNSKIKIKDSKIQFEIYEILKLLLQKTNSKSQQELKLEAEKHIENIEII
ncbi:hypothetical protein [Leptospira meyeri]|uniref:hypothetical protein n=1 Tax=Leptospira meyeri TaxID=29508 RepID=UPI00223D12F0|nr:hypothetical protein [Leptospira meyeri]MCW7490980.1 hypothetical protein [Leptospira meyeri]